MGKPLGLARVLHPEGKVNTVDGLRQTVEDELAFGDGILQAALDVADKGRQESDGDDTRYILILDLLEQYRAGVDALIQHIYGPARRRAAVNNS